jgi:hypothetical protein
MQLLRVAMFFSGTFLYWKPLITPNLYSFMTTEQQTSLEQEIEDLKATLTGDMFQDMDTRDQIHNLEMKLKGVKPMDSSIDCIGCGS